MIEQHINLSKKRGTNRVDLNLSDEKNPEGHKQNDDDYDWDNALVASDSVSLADKSHEDKSDNSTVGSLPQIWNSKKMITDFSMSSSVMSQDQTAFSSESDRARIIPEQLLRIAEDSEDVIVFERSVPSPRSHRFSRVLNSRSPKWGRKNPSSPYRGGSGRFVFEDISLGDGDSRASHLRDDNTEVATEIAGNLTSAKHPKDFMDESVFSDQQALNSLCTPTEHTASTPMDDLDKKVAAVINGTITSPTPPDKNQELTVAAGSDDPTEKLESFDHSERKRRSFPRWIVVTFAVFGTLALGAAVVLVVITGPGNMNLLSNESSPAETTDNRAKGVWEIASSVSGSNALNNSESFAFKAYDWLSRRDTTALTAPREFLVERYIVALLYFSTGGEGWQQQYNFLKEESICDWNLSSQQTMQGVFCDDDLKVKHLLLAENKLGGTIPSELSLLQSLRSLDLSQNYIDGEIPTKLGQLDGLQELNLMSNKINGRIPSALGSLSSLSSLDISSNFLSGSIPSDLGMLLNLESLSMGDNRLTGTIPSTFASLTGLTTLNLFRNQLSGTIPPSLSGLPVLTSVNFASNNFTGDISDGYCVPERTFDSFWADCRGEVPKVNCTCCTICCHGYGDFLEC